MNNKERYLFDLQGYLVLENVLSAEQLERMNRIVDDRISQPEDSILQWGEDFRALIDDSKLNPHLNEILGENYRLDHEYAIIHRKGAPQLGLHGGATPYDPGQYYTFRNNQMFSGLTVVSYALTDIGEDDGGFSCIPGSHKSNYRTPKEYLDYSEIGPTVHVPQKAGDVLIFTEALTHGTFAWKAEHERRSLLYKFAPEMISWSEHNRDRSFMDSLPEAQRRRLLPPASPGHRYHGY
ncbi:phytanoyl-CoA dioxygenase family protein [Paenibacillus lignilyticus]|uniref:Phytanoyl-CoA dioxygenase family protein n=1 Tax=Paenibacillus lignilyticus TaxID=1172615 RepID=A0ABS5CDG3_9BACL|nr:phytanoyl-CoA dioxygenase family protein [Paenibacillus lignilyticus]